VTNDTTRDDGTDEQQAAEIEPTGPLVDLLDRELLIPIRSSSGSQPDPALVSVASFRHGTDQSGRFLAAFESDEALGVLGPPGSDHVVLTGRELFERAEQAEERVIINPGSPDQVEIPVGFMPFLLAGIDLQSPAAVRARRRLGGLPDLEVPATIPEPFGSEMETALEELPAVERAWLLRVGTAWTVGVELAEDAPLAEFDAVRNRLHALAAEHLGSRRDLIVTDLRGPALRAHYEAAAPPFYEPPEPPKGLISRLLGRES
jgi:SseB protein N-terminal domain